MVLWFMKIVEIEENTNKDLWQTLKNGFQAHYMTIFLSFVDSSDNNMGSIGDDFFGVFWSIFCGM